MLRVSGNPAGRASFQGHPSILPGAAVGPGRPVPNGLADTASLLSSASGRSKSKVLRFTESLQGIAIACTIGHCNLRDHDSEPCLFSSCSLVQLLFEKSEPKNRMCAMAIAKVQSCVSRDQPSALLPHRELCNVVSLTLCGLGCSLQAPMVSVNMYKRSVPSLCLPGHLICVRTCNSLDLWCTKCYDSTKTCSMPLTLLISRPASCC